MKNKTTRFLIMSLILVIVLYSAIFVLQVIDMNRKSAETMTEIGEIYMEGMSEQITQHFGTVMELRLDQAEALADDVWPNRSKGYEELSLLLCSNARAREFDRLSFCMEDGSFERLYGNKIMPVDAEEFLQEVKRGEERMVMGTNMEGDPVILLSVPLSYQMPDGRKTVALVTGFSVNYIADTLTMELSDSLVYFVIRRDGKIVIEGDGKNDRNYYDKIQGYYNDAKESEETKSDLKEYAEGLRAAMAHGEDYTKELNLKNGRRQLYCKRLPYSEWYLILSMPYGMLDETIDTFSTEWINTAMRSGLIVIVLFLIVFEIYFRMIQRQMQSVEAARQEAERASRAKSEFLSNMSHDIRTPMNGIIGMTEIAGTDLGNEKKVAECLQKISRSSKHLLGLINDVLDMSKIESGKMILNTEQISLPEIVQNVINITTPQMREKRQRLELYIYDIIAEDVWGDSVRLSQILLNLLSNAVKYTQEEGTIQLELHQEQSEKGDSHARVHLHVIDNGIGMSEEFQAKIFDSFIREDNARVQKMEGAGLGMSITKYIVDAMGGTIQVQSERGKGSEFHVILDMEAAPMTDEKIVVPAWRTLVIDDDEVFCECTLATLESIGIGADHALDGKTALQMIEESHSKGEDYEIILSDWRLPKIDGIELTREIRERYGQDPHILMISATDNTDVEEQAREAGVDAFIVKPLFKSTLYYYLHKFTEEAEPVIEQEEEQIVFSGERILVAEDIDLNWEIANALLSEIGLEPEHAENGRICVDKFSQSPAGYYRAILMDIRMPEMTGIEAAAAIRALEREDAENIPIIAMSADVFSDDVERCLACGMNAHTAKPIDIEKISQLLKKYMEAS